MTAWKPLIVSSSAETTRRLRSALTDAGLPDPQTLADYPAPGALASIASRAGCTLCFIDLAANSELGFAAIGDAAPALPVVALVPCNDGDTILRALRRGAREFLAEPSPDHLRALLERLERAAAPPAPAKGRLLCVVPRNPDAGRAPSPPTSPPVLPAPPGPCSSISTRSPAPLAFSSS